jgi:hypothetical protein
MVRRIIVASFLAACTGAPAEYPKYKCEQLVDAPLDPASYVKENPRESLFADDRDAWKSNRCDPVRAALRPIDDAHDLEDETLIKDCDDASARADEAVRLACRAGCWAERRHTAEIAAWSRALKGVAAWNSNAKRTDLLELERSCPAMKTPPHTKDALGRALWMCAHLPLPPKRFEIGYQKRWKRDAQGQPTAPFTLDSMDVRIYEDEGRRMREVEYQECSGAGSRWAVFGRESP